MRDPYILPCGHSFCLRPCLLAQDGALKARCINCDVEFETTKLRPNHKIALQICLTALQEEVEEANEQEQTEEQQNQNKQAEKDGETQIKADAIKANAKGTLEMHLQQLKELMISELDPGQYAKAENVGALESAMKKLQETSCKALDSIIEKLQMDSYESIDELTQQIAELSIEVAKIRDVYSSLKGITQKQPASQDIFNPEVDLVNEGAAQTNTSAPIVSRTAKLLTRLINLNMAVNDLRDIRTSLQDEEEQSVLQYSRICEELNTAVATIEAALTRSLKINLLRVEANDISVQRDLENLRFGIGEARKVLPSIEDIFTLVYDEK
ncbi:unnamed protein product, partial [Hydatigera taeniaeformis]|uniref:Dynactin subunit 2 n=1 Tax=Hydatigena taeniaeformis TaxID=6205 RepID=A0A0R3X749_HYDTA